MQTSSRRSASSHGLFKAQTGSATTATGTSVRVCSRYDQHLHNKRQLSMCVCTALMKIVLLPGQTFDSILTLDMQIFGPTLTTFPPQSQAIITEGVANFLKSGVTASQIQLTVKDLIAGVSCPLASKSLLPYHLTNSHNHYALSLQWSAAQAACQHAGMHPCNLCMLRLVPYVLLNQSCGANTRLDCIYTRMHEPMQCYSCQHEAPVGGIMTAIVCMYG